MIERIGEDLREEVEEVKKKRERGYHALGIFVILGKSLRVHGFEPSYVVISIFLTSKGEVGNGKQTDGSSGGQSVKF